MILFDIDKAKSEIHADTHAKVANLANSEPIVATVNNKVSDISKISSGDQPKETTLSAKDIDRLIYDACNDLFITPDQLRAELEEGGDIRDLESGELSARGLRIVAETLNTMRYARS